MLRWPLGGFLVASALAHAAFFGLPWKGTPGNHAELGPVVVTLLPGPAAARQETHRPQAPRPVARPLVATRPSKPNPKPHPRPVPAPEMQQSPAPAAPAPAPTAAAPTATIPPRESAAAVSPDATSPPVAIKADRPPQRPAGSAAAVPGAAPLAAAFGSVNGPRILHLDDPVYPPRALRLRREGQVLLRLEINAGGTLQSVTVAQSAGYGFDASALKAVRRARLAPATKGGRPIPCVALLPVSFTLATRP